MKYKLFSNNNADVLLENKDFFKHKYHEMLEIVEKITDDQIISKFELIGKNSKSISTTLSKLIEEELLLVGWEKETEIFDVDTFKGNQKSSKRWSLDYFKDGIALEVAFNHEESSAWNIVKLLLASNPNKYPQKHKVHFGIILCVTNQMKTVGGFDNAIGTYEKYMVYLDVMEAMTNVPILLVGLHSPDKFKILHRKNQNRKIGKIRGTML